ncbi:MAG: TonB-dependent receptor [Mediterranea sp.]|jgi:TonB-linked SusC/RagA family outer membrane protein|nr:TonB-dependent receptor [Mediterranea sp.]
MKKQKNRNTSRWHETLFVLIGAFLLSVTTANAQNLTVKGNVKDINGEAIVGASVVRQGTSHGTISDIDGNFQLNVPADAILVVSYVGYENQTVNVNGRSFVSVTLNEDAALIDEVVVVGYGTQKKSDVTGALTSVPKDRLSKLPVTNVLQAIQGVAAGVNVTQFSSIPGEEPSVMVRGQNSINASTAPYIVVDGIPISQTGGSISDINPNDIASMEILKDASATAIYGINGANGVLLITTKRGTDDKPTIRYNGYVGFENIAHMMAPGGTDQMLARYAEYSRIQSSSLFQGSPVRNEYEFINYEAGRTVDWMDLVTRTGVITDHNVTISGGNKSAARYYVSADYMSQKGVLEGYNYKRYSIRTNLDMDVTKYLTVGTTSYIVSHNRDGGRVNLLNAAAMSPWARPYEDDGSLTRYPMYSESLWENPLLDTLTNPERRNWNISVNGYADLKFGDLWKPLQGLKYRLNVGFSYVTGRDNSYTGQNVFDEAGTASIANSEDQSWIAENILSYDRDFGKHHIGFTGVYAAKRIKTRWVSAGGSNFPNDVLGWNKLSAAGTESADSETTLYTTLSQMARINYSYDSRYLLTASIRRDGTSVFAPERKYATFPSIALGWNVTNEAFMEKTADVLNNLKLRLSYGESGNEGINKYATLSKMDTNSLAMGGQSLTTMNVNTTMGNLDLGWETTRMFNFGIDFGLWDNRINGSIDAYTSNTRDLLLRRGLPRITGYADVYQNIGKVKNTGLEITINSRNIVTRDFTWGTNLVFATNSNKLQDLYGNKTDDLGNRWFIGHPVGVIYDYTMLGIWQQEEIDAGLHHGWDEQAQPGDVKLADLDGNGLINDDDRRILGQTSPKWTGGLTNTFTYKDLSLSVFIQTVQGSMANNHQLSVTSDEQGRRNAPAEIGFWTPENKSNEWRSLSNTSNRHSYGYPRDNSYTTIKDITLSYNFPKKITDAIGIGTLQVYASGRNLYTFTDWIGWDPEGRDDLRGNTDYWEINYPKTRSFIFGLNVTF